MLIKKGSKGSHVVRMQENLDLLGFYTGENDGIYGKKSELATKNFQKSRGLKEDGIIGTITETAILNAVSSTVLTPSAPASLFDQLVDLRGKHDPPKLFGGMRTWSIIDGVTLHQTGCKMPSVPTGWNRLNAHIGINRFGQLILVNDPSMMIWHAQGLSKHTIGIEIEGNFAGIEGKRGTLWKQGGPECHLTDKMLNALDMCFEWLLKEFTANQKSFESVHAHRQSSQMREADPGSEIWQKVGMVWIDRISELNPDTFGDGGPEYCTKKGRPIPKEWNPTYKSKYWD